MLPRTSRALGLSRRAGSAASGPTATVQPSASGTTDPGDAISGSVGTWPDATSYVWAWQRNGADIAGASGTGTTVTDYTIVTADGANGGEGLKSLRLRVTATNAEGSTTAYSNVLSGPRLAQNLEVTIDATDASAVLGSLLTSAAGATAVTAATVAGDSLTLGAEADLSGNNGLCTVAAAGNLTFDPVRDFLSLASGSSTTVTGTFTLNNGGTGSITITIDGQFTAPVAADTTIFLVAGQSNATGRADWDSGNLYPAGAYQWGRHDGNDGVIIPAVYPLEHENNYALGRFGFALEFARDWVAANPGKSILFVPAAYGGSSLHSGDWSDGGTRYDDAVDRTNAALAALPGATFGGILWHQGESDTGNTANANAYQATRAQMVADMRSDITGADGTTPFLAGGLAPGFVGSDSDHLIVQGVIEETAAEIEYSAHVSSASLTDADGTHFDAASMRTLGSRYYTALAVAAGNVFATGGDTVEALSIGGTAYRRHTFTGPGTFTVPVGLGPLDVEAVSVGGGAGGAGGWGGGGGAGRVVLAGSGSEISISAGSHAVTIGAGGAAGGALGTSGGTTTFSTLVATGGGGGGVGGNPATDGADGGNGGGGGGALNAPDNGQGGTGTDNDGGDGQNGGLTRAGGGGGGSSGNGGNASGGNGGDGGAGTDLSAYGLGTQAGGGGGGHDDRSGTSPGSGGSGGGGNGGATNNGNDATGYGSGGGGGTWPSSGGGAAGGDGSAGVVVIQYPAAA